MSDSTTSRTQVAPPQAILWVVACEKAVKSVGKSRFADQTGGDSSHAWLVHATACAIYNRMISA